MWPLPTITSFLMMIHDVCQVTINVTQLLWKRCYQMVFFKSVMSVHVHLPVLSVITFGLSQEKKTDLQHVKTPLNTEVKCNYATYVYIYICMFGQQHIFFSKCPPEHKKVSYTGKIKDNIQQKITTQTRTRGFITRFLRLKEVGDFIFLL